MYIWKQLSLDNQKKLRRKKVVLVMEKFWS